MKPQQWPIVPCRASPRTFSTFSPRNRHPFLFVIPSAPGFPTSPLSPATTYVVLPKENHMQLTEAATLDRKSGGAEGSAVPRTPPGNGESRPQTELSSRPERSVVERSGVSLSGSRTLPANHDEAVLSAIHHPWNCSVRPNHRRPAFQYGSGRPCSLAHCTSREESLPSLCRRSEKHIR